MAAALPRKPIGPKGPPPYPTSPKQDLAESTPQVRTGQSALGLPLSRTSSTSSHDTWNSSSDDDEPTNATSQSSNLPPSLRPGPPSTADLAQPLFDSQSEWQTQAHAQSSTHKPSPPYPDLNPGPATANASSSFVALAPINPFTRPSIAQQSTGLTSDQSSWDNLAQLQHPPPQHTSTVHDAAPSAELADLLLEEKKLSHDQPRMTLGPTEASDSSPRPQLAESRPATSSNPWQNDLDRVGKDNKQPLIDMGSDTAADAWQTEPGHARPQVLAPSTAPTLNAVASPTAQSAVSRPEAQKNAIYHTRQISWYDGRNQSMRRSPMLTQNANGPCPLLALVNALILSTPATESTALHEALQNREQITLGLLLDVVFEELVRRNEEHGRGLPDIDDLYSFLVTLHTGMNVNPCFVSTNKPQLSEGDMPGSFEQTRDMRLYGTFGMALVHGWMMPADSAIHAAFARTAQSYDDAQNVQFREEELEEKAGSLGLNSIEQRMAQDILVIKQFLSDHSSQLTDYGLSVLSHWVQPGQIAILFRNDHFSTLYKEPRTGVLMTLVTDAGYANHDEIVWESLADVSGARSELFSGDFRPVGLSSAHRTTEDPFPIESSEQTTTTEQEDHDLALALQLQEEENEREEQAAAERRRREDELSQQFIQSEQSNQDGQAAAAPPALPNRSSTTSTRPGATAPSRTEDGEVAPPPTYEQAASDRPYREGDARLSLPPSQGDALGALHALSSQQSQQGVRPAASGAGRWPSGAAANNGRPPGGQPSHGPPPGHANTYGHQNSPYGRQDERCTVM